MRDRQYSGVLPCPPFGEEPAKQRKAFWILVILISGVGIRIWDLRFRAWDIGFVISGIGFGTGGFGFGVSGTCEKQRKAVWILVICVRAFWYLRSGSGFRVSGFGFQVSGFGFRISDFGFRGADFGFQNKGLGCRVSG